MADEVKKAAAPVAEKVRKKELRPTNCAQSNKRIRRKDWYYRDGKYFANKQAFKLFVVAEAEKKAKAQAAADAAAQAAQAAATAAASAAAEAPKAAE